MRTYIQVLKVREGQGYQSCNMRERQLVSLLVGAGVGASDTNRAFAVHSKQDQKHRAQTLCQESLGCNRLEVKGFR